MKKITAILLAAAMALSLAACTSKSKSTKKTSKKTKRTSKTVETDETEDPTETPSESETPTETETETEPTTLPNVLTFDESLDYLGLSTPLEDWGFYSVFDKNEGETYTYGLIADRLELPDDSHAVLQQAIDEDIAAIRDAEIDLFYTEGEQFLNDGAAGKTVSTNIREFRTPIFRSDTQIFSFALTDSKDLAEGEFLGYNYLSENGQRLTQDDVVLDREGLAQYFSELFSSPDDDDDYRAWVQQKMDDILNGKLQFTMSYDAINVLGEGYNFDFEYYAYKIPVIGHEELFNLEYFGSTPNIYSIRGDFDDKLVWDVDGDGVLDEIVAEGGYDGGAGPDSFSLTVRYNNYTFDSIAENVDIVSYGVDELLFMKSDDGNYLYVRMTAPDSFMDTYVFKIENNKLTYVDIFYDFFRTGGLIDPSCFGIADIFDTLGSGVFYNEVSILSNGGMPDTLYNYWNSTQKGVTCKKDISGTIVDQNTLDRQGATTISAGSYVRPYLYNPLTQSLIVEVLNEDLDENIWVELDFKKDEDWNITVDGQNVEDMFYSIMFWG